MKSLNRILVPVDFSPGSEDAVRYAAALAGGSESEIHLLHVLPPPEFGFAMVEPDLNGLLAKRSEAASGKLAQLPFAGQVSTVRRVAEGEAAPQIIEYANRHEMDAVVMPTRGRGRVERLLLIGSVTMKVLHALEMPVITSVHFGSTSPERPVNHVLCAVDLGPATERVVCAAQHMAARFGAKLSIAHAVAVFGHAAGEAYGDAQRDAVIQHWHGRLDEVTRRLFVKAETFVEPDQAPRAISSLALRLGADLVVLGRGEAGGLIGRLRADAYDIIRLCHCPAMSV
jgi:nucleotide-binding universal stress UspA family protein